MATEEVEAEDGTKVVYKDEKPFLFLLKVVGITGVVLVVSVFLLGMALQFAGVRVPTFDKDVVINNLPDSSSSTSAPVDTREEIPTTVTQDTDATGPINRESEAYRAGREAGHLFRDNQDDIRNFWSGFNRGASE